MSAYGPGLETRGFQRYSEVNQRILRYVEKEVEQHLWELMMLGYTTFEIPKEVQCES